MSFRGLVLLAGLLTLAGCATNPAARPRAGHRIVVEVSADNPKVWEAVMNNVENLETAFRASGTSIEVVGLGGGLGMLLSTNSAQAERLQRLSAGGVVFAACENTMRKKNVSRADLLPFVTTVDSGVAEVVRKQEQGWSYIKSGF
jgi:intracellular sulfur oxidation DsrE/DsrF family protein